MEEQALLEFKAFVNSLTTDSSQPMVDDGIQGRIRARIQKLERTGSHCNAITDNQESINKKAEELIEKYSLTKEVAFPRFNAILREYLFK